MVEHIIYFDDPSETQVVLGSRGELLPEIENVFPVKLSTRDIWLKISGEEKEISRVDRFIQHIREAHHEGVALDKTNFRYLLKAFKTDRIDQLKNLHKHRIQVSGNRKSIFPKTVGQLNYIKDICKHDICLGVGPAGTGKTYLAMAIAVSNLLQQKVNRIILTRPAVEAGETLGFLPGDMYEKVQPYLKPLYDALRDMMSSDMIERNMDRGIIEVAPLAFMRGRTLNNSFIILDEAQNTTPEQMLMFLTRMGFDSKVVVTGDPTQIDLPQSKISGLTEVLHVLKNIPGIAIRELQEMDVVRHELVQKIVVAYRDSRKRSEENGN